MSLDFGGALRRSWAIWVWRPALEIAVALTLLGILFAVTDGELDAIDVISPVMNGIVILLVLASFLSLRGSPDDGKLADRRWAADHPWQFAFLPALMALITLLPIRAAMLIFDVEGPWTGVWESGLDIVFRVVVVYGVVGGIAAYLKRSPHRSP